MSDEQKSKVETIEDAFEKTLADMMSARDELEAASKEPLSPDVVTTTESAPEPIESVIPAALPDIVSDSGIPTTPDTLSPLPSGPPMMGPPPGPPMGGPPGPPMMGPPPGPPMGGPPGPPMMDPPPIPPMEISPSPLETPPVTTEEEPPAPVVADLSELVGGVPVQEALVDEVIIPELEPELSAPKFIPVDADDFISEFEDEWDESAPVRISDIDDTEDMDW